MNKLFVVFCRELSQQPKVLKTKSYARSLLKKNLKLHIQQFNDEEEAQLFIQSLKGERITPPILETPPQPPILQHIIPQCVQLESIKEYTLSNVVSADVKPPKSIAREGIMRYFRPGKPLFHSLSSPTIIPQIHQNQNPGVTTVSYSIDSQNQSQNSVLVGQKYRHEAQLLSVIYALADLSLNDVKEVTIVAPSPYAYTLLKSQQTCSSKLQGIIQHFHSLSKQFDQIRFEESVAMRPPGRHPFRQYHSSSFQLL